MQPRTTPPPLEPIFLFMKPNENSKQAVRSAAARSAHARARRARMLEYWDVDNAEAAGSQDASVEPSQVAISSGRQVAHRASTDLAGPILGYGRRDPFASLAIQCTPFENLLLDHYVNIVIPYSTTYYTPSTYRSPAEYTSNMNEHWIRFALTEPGMMNGIFLMSCRSLANLYNQKEYNVSALKYKQKCIEMVRHDIDRNQSISDLTIAKVLFLVSDEFHTGNIEGTRSHTEAIGKLVQMRGGLKALGLEGTLQELVLWNDRMSTFYTGTRPNFMHAGTFVDSATAKYLTPGFYHAATDGLFSKDMIQILDDICGATLLTQKVETTSAGPELQLDFSSRLLVLSSDHRCPASSHNYSLFEQCLCLALMVFVKLALRSQTSGASYGPLLGSSYLAMRIQQFLERLVAAEMEEAKTGGRRAELLLWMAAMGAWADSQTPLAASERDEDQQEGQTLVLGTSLWRELVRDLDINTLDDFRVHMLSFLWLDESCGLFATNLWESRRVIEIQES